MCLLNHQTDKLMVLVSESNANLWEIAEESYNAFNPSAATGVTFQI
jgi:predicted oxidoreductase (fatty acid repression mutant protein)